MPYDLLLDGAPKDVGDLRYLLSPKDLAGAGALQELLRIGVHGLKIEGRQKGPEYVATATRGYRRWRDALAAGADLGAAQRQLALDLRDMTSTYSRGFGLGFLAGSNHQDLVEGRFPKHRGHYLGRVLAVAGHEVVVQREAGARPWTGARALAARPAHAVGEVAAPLGPAASATVPLPELRPGLGIGFDTGAPEASEPGGPLFAVHDDGARVRLCFGVPGPDLTRVRAGDRVWITSDPETDRRARAGEETGRVAVDFVVRGQRGEPLCVNARAGTHTAEVASAMPLDIARGEGLDVTVLRDKLAALGGTPFHLRGLELGELAPGLHVPVSELKELRRQLVDLLLPQLERGALRQIAPDSVVPRLRARGVPPAARWQVPATPQLVPLVRTVVQLEAVLASGLPEVELDFMELQGLAGAVARARAGGLRVVVATLRVTKPGERAFDERLLKLAPDGVLVRHLGAAMLFTALPQDARPVLHGDFALNVTNSVTAGELFALGLDTLTPAHDLDRAQLRALLGATQAARLTATLHVRMPTFHTEHCVYAHVLSNGRDFRSCGRPCEHHQLALRDHKGCEHPVLVDAGCRNTVFHGTLQTSATLAGELLGAGVRRFRVEFVREDGAATAHVLAAYGRLLRGEMGAAELQAEVGAEPHIGVASKAQATLA
jgi:putative protease